MTRSHQPAVGIVPPGMHRINAKGSGRSTKRNEMRKERRLIKSKEKKMTISDVLEQTPLEGTNDGVSDTVASRIIPTANANILSFRPRNVKGRPKKRI